MGECDALGRGCGAGGVLKEGNSIISIVGFVIRMNRFILFNDFFQQLVRVDKSYIGPRSSVVDRFEVIQSLPA